VRCLSPRTVGFKADGKTISWSQKDSSPEYATFQLPCSKCIECRLEYARDTAIRCVHEAKMYENNSFITLTYSDEKLKSPKLQYSDFQLFIKKLRSQVWEQAMERIFPYAKTQSERRKAFRELSKETQEQIRQTHSLPVLVTGEYGDIRKRPHWHTLIFNYRPKDLIYKYSNERGDKVYSSDSLDKIWTNGITEIGNITFESAGYCARYAAKKLIHGNDQDHQFQPIHKRSSKHAIGKKFLEKYYQDIFNYGKVVLEDGTKCTIPRYYEKWFKTKHPELWEAYVTRIKLPKIFQAENKQKLLDKKTQEINHQRLDQGKQNLQITRNTVRTEISKQKFKRLQQHLKGDI